MVCLRLSVIVMPAAPRSHFLAANAAPDQICWNSMSKISCLTPSSLASPSSRSTSNPTTLPPSLYWNGL